MKKGSPIIQVLLLLAFFCGILSCKRNNTKSDSSNSETMLIAQFKGYGDGHKHGYFDGTNDNSYSTSFNLSNGEQYNYEIRALYEKEYRNGYKKGFDEGKKEYDEDLAQRIEYAKQVLEEYEADNSSESTQRTSSSTSSPNVASGSIHSNKKAHGNYPHYVETSNCVEGVVVYEGNNDYYIIETKLGYTIAEWYDGRLFEGDMLRGELNTYNFHYIINRSDNSEVRVYIQDYMLSRNKAIEWMGEHEKLKNRDQEAYNSNKDN